MRTGEDESLEGSWGGEGRRGSRGDMVKALEGENEEESVRGVQREV